MKSDNPPRKHHYIPQFLLEQWTIGGKLYRYTQPIPGKISRYCKPAKATGFKEGLYKIPKLPDELAQEVEIKVMKPIDDLAAIAHRKLLTEEGFNKLTSNDRVAWVTFILALDLRTPDSFSAYKTAVTATYESDPKCCEVQAEYEKTKRPKDPDTYAEYLAINLPVTLEQEPFYALTNVIQNKELGQYIVNMHWNVLEISNGSFLLSDEPLLMLKGIKLWNGYIALPISPTKLFLATNNAATFLQIKGLAGSLLHKVNMQIVEGAKVFVAARDTDQEAFIQTHFGKNPRKSVIQHVAEQLSAKGAS